MSRKVHYARLQTGAYVVGAGELGTVLPPNTKTLSELTMHTSESALHVNFIYRGIKKELMIPFGNVILMELSPEEAKPKSSK